MCECFAGRLVLGAGDEMLLVFAVSCSVRQSAVAMNINIFFLSYLHFNFNDSANIKLFLCQREHLTSDVIAGLIGHLPLPAPLRPPSHGLSWPGEPPRFIARKKGGNYLYSIWHIHHIVPILIFAYGVENNNVT